MKTKSNISVSGNRLVSLGYSIQSHKVIEKEAREALSRLQHYSDKGAALEEAQRVIHALMSHSVDAVNFDVEHGG